MSSCFNNALGLLVLLPACTHTHTHTHKQIHTCTYTFKDSTHITCHTYIHSHATYNTPYTEAHIYTLTCYIQYTHAYIHTKPHTIHTHTNYLFVSLINRLSSPPLCTPNKVPLQIMYLTILDPNYIGLYMHPSLNNEVSFPQKIPHVFLMIKFIK